MPSVLWHVALEKFLLQSVGDSMCLYVYACLLQNKVVFMYTVGVFLYLYDYVDSVDQVMGICVCLQ